MDRRFLPPLNGKFWAGYFGGHWLPGLRFWMMLPFAREFLPKRQPRWLVTRPPWATAGDANPQTLNMKSQTVIYSAHSVFNEPVISGEDAKGIQVFCAVGVCKQLGGEDRMRRTPGGPGKGRCVFSVGSWTVGGKGRWETVERVWLRVVFDGNALNRWGRKKKS